MKLHGLTLASVRVPACRSLFPLLEVSSPRWFTLDGSTGATSFAVSLITDSMTNTAALPRFEVISIAGKGRGVVIRHPVARGACVEVSHYIRVPKNEYEVHVRSYIAPSKLQVQLPIANPLSLGRHTVFEDYLFRLKSGDHLLALGLGSLFNHSEQPNLDYRVDADSATLRFFAVRDIAEGEELCFFYGSNLWFKDAVQQDRTEETPMHRHLDDEKAFLSGFAV